MCVFIFESYDAQFISSRETKRRKKKKLTDGGGGNRDAKAKSIDQ